MRLGLVVDTSALLAVLFSEPERGRVLDQIFAAERRWLSAFSLLETSILVVSRRGLAGRTLLEGLLRELGPIRSRRSFEIKKISGSRILPGHRRTDSGAMSTAPKSRCSTKAFRRTNKRFNACRP